MRQRWQQRGWNNWQLQNNLSSGLNKVSKQA
jgi:hypothetical protein